VFPKVFLLLQDIRAGNRKFVYQTEKKLTRVKDTYKMLIILCLWYLISYSSYSKCRQDKEWFFSPEHQAKPLIKYLFLSTCISTIGVLHTCVPPHPFFPFEILLWPNTTQMVITHICVIFSRRKMSLPISSVFEIRLSNLLARKLQN